jgi:Flp pilus assembly protein TadG
MRCGFGADSKRRWRAEHGGVAVEFAIIFPVLMLLLFGIIDFGHAWYMRHLMSDACREGARYGARYNTDNSNNRILPAGLNPSISNYVLQASADNGNKGGWALTSKLPADASPQVTPTGPGWNENNPSTLAGKDLIITVTATKTWFVLGKLIPSLGSSKTLTVATTMTCE